VKDPLLEVAGLTVRFPRARRAALQDVRLTLQPGELVLVVGPSGSGKSTLLRALAGVVPHSVRAAVTGAVLVHGEPGDELDVARRSRWCGYLAQDPATSICLGRVDDEVAFPLENRAVPREEIKGRVVSALAEHGLGGLADRSTSTLSGGQLQRVALAASLVSRPEVLLLDEPTALLDTASAQEVARAIARVADGAKPPAVLLVEHRLDELAEAGALPPRVVVLDREGRVRADGPTDVVLRVHARDLVRDGVWLPLDVELEIATGSAHPSVSALTERAADGNRVERPLPDGGVSRAPVLSARGLTVSRGIRPVLADVALELSTGEVTAVLGRNGAGKTSLLLALAGLLPAADVADGVVTGGSVGLVFQRPELQFVARTVREEVTRGAAPGLAARFLREMALEDLAERDPYRLSGGQQRRLSLAAVAAQGHDVLLADEPTFGLDRKHAGAVAQMLRHLAGEGRAVLLSTHDLRLAALVADRFVVLDGGRVRAAGPVEAILRSGALEEAGIPLPRLLASWAGTPGIPVRDLLHGLQVAVEEGAGPSTTAAEGAQLWHPFRCPPAPRLRGAGAGEHQWPHRDARSRAGDVAHETGAASSTPPHRTGWLHRRNPAVKLCVLLVLTSALMLVLDPATPAVAYAAFTLSAPAAAGVSPLRVLRAQMPLLSFALSLVAVNAVTRAGEIVAVFGPLEVTDEGLAIGAALALRMAAIASAAVLFVLSTDAVALLRSLEQQLRVPPRAAYAVLATHRLLETLGEDFALARAAQRMRRGRHSSPWGTAAELGAAAFALLVGALRRGERLAVALETRGLGQGDRTHWRPLRVTPADWALVAATAGLLALAVLAHVTGLLTGPQAVGVF
jgi:energy-coupling factor transporter ATP-binding protein EcfA2/energy-coupling factor transporter transmembrane protein EcfT